MEHCGQVKGKHTTTYDTDGSEKVGGFGKDQTDP